MAALVQDDPRFGFENGLWHIKQNNGCYNWALESAFLCMESSNCRTSLRGTIRLPSGVFVEFQNSRDGKSVSETLAQLSGNPLWGWNHRDLKLWNLFLITNGFPEWGGAFASIKTAFSRLLGRQVRSLDALASFLNMPAPLESNPKETARFLSDCFPLLLDRVSSEHKADIKALIEWLDGLQRSADFTQFGFDKEFLCKIPELPGTYVMKDRNGGVIYVGQSRNLKRRVRSYFAPGAKDQPKIQAIHSRLFLIEIHPTKNEIEALLMEIRLIRKLRPSINLQTEVHEHSSKSKSKNLILIVRGDKPGTGCVYFLHNGCFKGRQPVRLHTFAGPKLRNRVRQLYFGQKKSRSKEPWEQEIVARWISRNAKHLNWVDVDKAGTCESVIARLNDYLHDSEDLKKKVFYQ